MIVVYGTVCLDLTYRVPNLPVKGGYVEAEGERRALGGEAANTAAALKKWGADVVLVGNSIGTGPGADEVRRGLEQYGLGDAIFPSADHAAPACNILVTPDGERTMFGYGFAEMERRSDVSLFPREKSAWFTVDPNHGATARQALMRAHEAGMQTYALDFANEDDAVPPGSFWQSSTDWAGTPDDPDANAAWLFEWLKTRDCTAILTDADGGFQISSRQRSIRHLPPFPVEGVVDSTGAGDIFRAGMLFCLDQGLPLNECLKFAAAAAALNCLGYGALGALPTRDEVNALVKSQPDIAMKYDEAV